MNENSKYNFLFVCGANRWRSPTAETVYRDDERIHVRSAGVSSKSRHRISADDVLWADLILVMENSHKARIADEFRHLDMPRIECLNIPDDYEYMDDELVEMLRISIEHHIAHFRK